MEIQQGESAGKIEEKAVGIAAEQQQGRQQGRL